MHTFVLEKISNMYDKLDSVIITNKYGVIEYSALFEQGDNSMTNAGYTGHSILEVYPELNEETSTHFIAMRTRRPVLDEVQTLTDFNGKKITLISSTYPIDMDGEIIGAIEGTIYVKENGEAYRTREISKNRDNEPKRDRLYCLDDIITADEKMLALKEQLERVAAGESFVMIYGNTGTGKELFAQSLHTHSPRAKYPFISQNCAAIPSGLLESTLFGTTKGSYTGAEDKKGLLELANNGTLFLDEINSMEISLQGKILKAIEEQKIRRVGGEKEHKINVRIVSAMNVSPESAIESGKIREDLFYRLGVIQLRLPNLVERKNDIGLLTDYFIDYYNRVTKNNIKGCSELVKKVFLNYSWPGNVREFRNTIEYAFNMARGDMITIADVPERFLFEKDTKQEECLNSWETMISDGMPLTAIVDNFEKEIIKEVCKKHTSTTEAAKELNITRQALNYKLQKYNISIGE